MRMIPEPLLTPSSPVVARETHDDDMTLASHSAYNSGPYGAYWDSHAAFNPPWTLYPNSSQPVEQYIRDPTNYPHDGPSAYQSLSHATHYYHPSASNEHSFIPRHPPSRQSFSPSLPHWFPRQTSTGHLEPDPRFRLVPPQQPRALSRRGRGARAIEYDGLWIDEEELLEGLTEPNGKLNVHQCLWEEDRSPCPLWIKGDKSSISAHIQKWHRGRPGKTSSKLIVAGPPAGRRC